MRIEDIYEAYLQCGAKVTTDSRSIVGGEMFVALRGDNFDANDYALSAVDSGAKYAIVDKKSLQGVDSRLIVVEDSLVALQQLAAFHRKKLGVKIFALTGTNGKTTTKELVRVALETKYKNVGCTAGNLNNHIGVPLTLLGFDSKTEIGVVEMGANHIGEIKLLCSIARPDVGLITNVGRAHLEGFGSLEGVIKTKGELFDFLLANDGIALYNEDDKLLDEMIARRVGLQSVAYSGKGGIRKPLKLFGEYNQRNAAAALTVACWFGADPRCAVEAIVEYEPTNNRSEVVERSKRGNRLVVDCYNANPSSMEAAVGEFLRNESEEKRPKVMILGSMRELGEYSVEEHRRLVEMRVGDVRCFFVGEEFEGVAPSELVYANVEALIEALEREPIEGCEILIKGSRGNRLEKILPKI